MRRSIEITVNGTRHRLDDVAPHTSLSRWLRASGMTGTKEGCAEGDCGACTVVIAEKNADGGSTLRAINSCIALVPMLDGKEVWTVEGVAKPGARGALPAMDDLHPVQRAMVERYGSQCGYCTPGFVMSMVEGYYRQLPAGDDAAITDQLHGNLCRCTGYKPIRDAMTDALSAPRPADDLIQLRLKGPVGGSPELEFESHGERFVRPVTLESLCRALAENPRAELIGGATEIGVEINKKAKHFPLLVSTEGVAILQSIVRTATDWQIGGAATLTNVEDTVAKEHPALAKMLSVFASRPIRSRATVAGNLITASPIGDLAPVLLALDARVRLSRWDGNAVAEREIPLGDFFTGYRATVRARDELMTAIVVPHAPAGRVGASFKVSKRRELDISIVAAAFAIDLDSSRLVTHARLAYGGVAATPVRAKQTESLLMGKSWSEETLALALQSLAHETKPIDDVRSGKDYRVGLVGSLFEKFFRGETSQGQDEPLGFQCTPRREVGDGSRVLQHEAAIGHVTGAARYVDDEAQGRGAFLELWPVSSPHAHAKILRRDATKALGVPGVVRVLFAEDIPGQNDVGAVRKDETLLARDEVQFVGHMVAVVVGDSYEACRAAAQLVEVEYEPLPAIVGLPAAIAQSSYHTQPHTLRKGDARAALSHSPHRLSFSLEIGGQEHFYLESQAAWAACGDDGDVRVSSSTQHPSEVQAIVSHVLHVPKNKVVVTSPRMGGGFGGKETQGNTWAALVALAAFQTRRPVRVQLDRDVDMALTGKRHPFFGELEVGYDDTGRLTAVVANLVSDGGWALDLSESILDRALFHLDNAYDLPTAELVGRVAKTHVVSHTAFRGFGGPQGMVLIEEALDRVARALGLPPETVRERNLYRDGGTTPYGQSIEVSRGPRIWSELVAQSGLSERRQQIEAFNRANAHKKRGVAITPVKFGISFTATFLNQAGALVLAYRDGSVQVNHGGTEMGQGLHTKMRGVAMRELGLMAEQVRVMKTTTDKVPNTSATAASSGADLNGAAVRAACVTLRERLLPVAAGLLDCLVEDVRFEGGAAHGKGRSVPFADVCERAYVSQISLSANGYYRTPGIGYDKAAGRGKPFYYFAWGAAVSEVEVDALSGMKRVCRVDILHDVGDSLHPSLDIGQIEGAFVQGMGWLTGEELKWDARGRLMTHSASTYQIPSIGDAPPVFNVSLLKAATQDGVIHGSKAVGEPPLMLAISVREALKDAIAAFGNPGGTVDLKSPATHEAIYSAIRARA